MDKAIGDGHLKFKINHFKFSRGFVLIEALMAVTILSIVVIAFLGGMSQWLRAAGRYEKMSHGILMFEELIYGLESGERADLAYYGGKGQLDGYRYEIKSTVLPSSSDISFSNLQMRLSWNGGKDSLSLETFMRTEGHET